MNANRARDEVLYQNLEAPNVCTIFDEERDLVVCRFACSLFAGVSTQTTRVVAKRAVTVPSKNVSSAVISQSLNDINVHKIIESVSSGSL